jgi:hypothetical protein
MTTTQIKTAKATKVERHGRARWRGLTPSEHMLDTGTAWLSIETERGESHYWVRRWTDECGTSLMFKLTRFDYETNQPLAEYDIDCTVGPTPDFWVCDCPDAQWRNPDGGCKHKRALVAALARLGLL